jgi:hypothetical protein
MDSVDENLNWHLEVLGLRPDQPFFSLPQLQGFLDTLFVPYSSPTGLLMGVQRVRAVLPVAQQPALLQIASSYTSFHSQVTARCGFEYPAVCLQCGQILDASGKGLCTTHMKKCGGDSGVLFLLQVMHNISFYFFSLFLILHIFLNFILFFQNLMYFCRIIRCC